MNFVTKVKEALQCFASYVQNYVMLMKEVENRSTYYYNIDYIFFDNMNKCVIFFEFFFCNHGELDRHPLGHTLLQFANNFLGQSVKPSKYDFSFVFLCIPDCGCETLGTVNGNLECDQLTGQCECKATTNTPSCGECADTYYRFPTSIESVSHMMIM